MKKLFLILTLTMIAITMPAMAQDKKDAPKEPPAEVTISADAVKTIEHARLIADNKALIANNLSLQIQKAQDDLKKLTEDAERAASELRAEMQRQAIRAGIPGDSLKEYEETPKNEKGEIVLKRRKPPANTPASK